MKIWFIIIILPRKCFGEISQLAPEAESQLGHSENARKGSTYRYTPTAERKRPSPTPAIHRAAMSIPRETEAALRAEPTAKIAQPNDIVHFLEIQSATFPATMPVKAEGTRMIETRTP